MIVGLETRIEGERGATGRKCSSLDRGDATLLFPALSDDRYVLSAMFSSSLDSWFVSRHSELFSYEAWEVVFTCRFK